MSQPSQSSRPCGHVLHTAPDLYILVRYQPKKDQPNLCRALCELVDPDDPTEGNGFVFYLSPFDAHIDAALVSAPGKHYHAIHAADFDPRQLIEDNGGKLHYFLHCGWGASDGKIVVREKGSLSSIYGIECIHVSPDTMNSIDLKVASNELNRYNRVRDGAGLFAHAECYERVLSLDESLRMQHVARAIESIPGTVSIGARINQVAVYDFETMHWHFVPIGVCYDTFDILEK